MVIIFLWSVESDVTSRVQLVETTPRENYSFHQHSCRKARQLQIQESLKCHMTSHKQAYFVVKYVMLKGSLIITLSIRVSKFLICISLECMHC
jgi:hypothetical protein